MSQLALSGRQKRTPLVAMRGLLSPTVLICSAAVLLVAYLALVPIGFLLWNTFYSGDGLTLEFFRSAYRETGLGSMMTSSALFALGSTLVAVTTGTFLAYVHIRTDAPFKVLTFAASLMPLVIPGILYTISWIFLASPRIGILNAAVGSVIGARPFDIFTLTGMSLVEGLHLSPLVFLLMAASFRSMDPSLEESALMSGASRRSVLRRITIPMSRPALYAAVLIMVVRALEAFEVPVLLGIPGGIWVFTSRVWRALDHYPANFGEAGAYSMSLLLLTAAGVAIYSRLPRAKESYRTITGRGRDPRKVHLGRWRPVIGAAVVCYFIVAVLLPVVILIYLSTQPFYSLPTWEHITNMSLDNYRYIFEHDQVLRSVRNSVLLGTGSATLVMIVMAIVAWVVVRTTVPGRSLIDSLASLPLVIPGLVMGVALLFAYLRAPLPIYGSLLILLIAYVTRYMPYGMRYASASMQQISAELEESAYTSGADWWQSFRRIYLPLLLPGLTAGWIYITTVSVRELSSSLLLYSPGNEVLSVMIWEQWENGQFTELAALGVLMVLGLMVLAAVAYRIGIRTEQST